MKLNRKHTKKWLLDAASIVAGNLLLAFLVAAFVMPHDIIMGGATGIGIVLDPLLPLDTAAIVLIFNLFTLLLGGLTLGKKFLFATVASSVLYPAFLAVMQRIPGIDRMTDNVLLATLCGGGLLGVALGLVMRIGASTGGTDALNLIMHKYLHWSVSLCVWIVDAIIIGAQALFAAPESILYGIVMLVIESLVLDQVMVLGSSQIQIFVVTPHHEVIRCRLLTELEAGVTMLLAQTGHSRREQPGVLCVIPKRKLHAASRIIQDVDENAFITITQIKEVHGRGFTRERVTLDTPQSCDT
ncbi:MAG: YitT family protein [Clostridia bacterium]|nr:YitT family protein [Clostridia bacterium]